MPPVRISVSGRRDRKTIERQPAVQRRSCRGLPDGSEALDLRTRGDPQRGKTVPWPPFAIFLAQDELPPQCHRQRAGVRAEIQAGVHAEDSEGIIALQPDDRILGDSLDGHVGLGRRIGSPA